MRIDTQAHLEHPWQVHTLAADFELLDVWELAIDDGRDMGRLIGALSRSFLESDDAIVAALVALRAKLGGWFGWDTEKARPIPGCSETSLVDRLSEDDRKATCIAPGSADSTVFGEVRHVYRFANETLLEISNATIHALIHLSWPESSRPRLAVYIKSRGLGSRLYMASIKPFRHLVVYPAMMKSVQRQWHLQR